MEQANVSYASQYIALNGWMSGMTLCFDEKIGCRSVSRSV